MCIILVDLEGCRQNGKFITWIKKCNNGQFPIEISNKFPTL